MVPTVTLPIVRQTSKFGKDNHLLSPMTFCLIHAADFADRLDRTILPPLRAGAIVLTDRYVYTAFARDAARGVAPDYVRDVYRFAPRPSAAFYFKVPLEEALRRILTGRPELKYYEAGMDLGLSDDPYESFKLFQGRILDRYEEMVPEFGLTVNPLIERPGNATDASTPGCLRAISDIFRITASVRSSDAASGSCAKATRYCLSWVGTKPVGTLLKPHPVSAIKAP